MVLICRYLMRCQRTELGTARNELVELTLDAFASYVGCGGVGFLRSIAIRGIYAPSNTPWLTLRQRYRLP